MTKKMITAATIMLTILFLAGAASALEDIAILPNVNPIDVPIDPNPISPPISVNYTGWTTTGTSQYTITVSDGGTPLIGACIVSGPITSDPQIVKLPTCKIPASLKGKTITIVAEGKCPQGGCSNMLRSKDLFIDANLNPVPEVPTGILATVGLVGLIGLVRYGKKNN